MTVERMIPLYEAKMLHHYDHRWATYADGSDSRELHPSEKKDPSIMALPRYWIRQSVVIDAIGDDDSSMLAFRDICRSTDERTVIITNLPRVAAGHTAPVVSCSRSSSHRFFLLSLLSSFAFDFVARQKIGGTHLTYNYFQQLPVLEPSMLDRTWDWLGKQRLSDWIQARALELVYTAWDLEPLACDVGYTGAPFRWDPERRAQLRAELDAAFFHLYGLSREDTDYVMDTFPIVRRNDEKEHGEYRTKRLILEVYDALAEAMRLGKAYRSPLFESEGAR